MINAGTVFLFVHETAQLLHLVTAPQPRLHCMHPVSASFRRVLLISILALVLQLISPVNEEGTCLVFHLVYCLCL